MLYRVVKHAFVGRLVLPGHNPAMETIGARIKIARIEARLSVPALAALCSVSRQAVYQWERDDTVPTGPNLVAISGATGVTSEWLATGDEPKHTAKGSRELEALGAPIVNVPVISWIAAGALREIVDPHELGEADEHIPTPYRHEGLIALRVHGRSMNLIAPEGAAVVVDYTERDLIPRKLYVVNVGGEEATFKRYQSNPDRFEPNSTDEFETIFPVEEWWVIGRVVRVVTDL